MTRADHQLLVRRDVLLSSLLFPSFFTSVSVSQISFDSCPIRPSLLEADSFSSKNLRRSLSQLYHQPSLSFALYPSNHHPHLSSTPKLLPECLVLVIPPHPAPNPALNDLSASQVSPPNSHLPSTPTLLLNPLGLFTRPSKPPSTTPLNSPLPN